MELIGSAVKTMIEKQESDIASYAETVSFWLLIDLKMFKSFLAKKYQELFQHLGFLINNIAIRVFWIF